MALSEVKADAPAWVAKARPLEPGHRLIEVRNTSIDPTRLYFPIATRPFRGCRIIRQGPERQRLVTIFYTSLWITLLDVCHAHAPQADDRETDIVDGGAEFDGMAAVVLALLPFAECDCRRTQIG